MNTRNILLTLIILVVTINCKKKSADNENNYLGEMSQDSNQTKLVKVDGLQVAFDFMEMGYHKKMMKLMKVKMEHLEGATHGLMVTVMDDKTKDIIKDAGVILSVIYPDGHQEKSASEVMLGEGMHHYAIHLKASKKGTYKISAFILYKGHKYTATTDFIN